MFFLFSPQHLTAEVFPQKLFNAERDQPRLQKLFWWDGRIIAQAGEFFFEIDPDAGSSIPIHFVGDRSMISLATAFDKPFALGGSGDFYRVLFHRSGKNDWDMIRVPQNEKGKEDRYSVIVGDENSIVLLGQNSLRMFDGTTWIYRSYQNEFHPNNSDSYTLWNGNLYYGYDRGEFGGGLYKLILSTGEWVTVDHEMPFRQVSDLCLTPNGNLKIVCGLSHLGGRYGRISTLTPKGIENDWVISNHGESDRRWKYEITDFSTLRFNKAGEQILFTPHLGLLVYRDDKWIRITPNWRNHFYVSSFLILNDNKYVLGTYDAGVVIINLKDKTEKIIRLATSFYKWEEK